MISSYEFHGPKPGKTLVIFGAIHGDEICGPTAIHAIKQEIEQGILTLTRGRLIFVPVCNPRAYENNTRFIEHNLNRVFRRYDRPSSYEARLANELCSILEWADYLLDIHSISSEGKPFVFEDYNDPDTHSFVSCLGIQDIITGWPEMYATREDSDTIGYAHAHGIIGTVIECGNHNSPEATQIARHAIFSALVHLDMIAGTHSKTTTRSIRAKHLYIKEKSGNFAKQWNHLDRLHAGEKIAMYSDGSIIQAPYDGYILLPHHTAHIGTEWFYFWEEECPLIQ